MKCLLTLLLAKGANQNIAVQVRNIILMILLKVPNYVIIPLVTGGYRFQLFRLSVPLFVRAISPTLFIGIQSSFTGRKVTFARTISPTLLIGIQSIFTGRKVI